MSDRAKQLLNLLVLDLLGRHIAEPEALTLTANPGAFDLDATGFLNSEPGELETLVLAPDATGRQLIVDRGRRDEPWASSLPAGHWIVRAEVICWAVQVTLHSRTGNLDLTRRIAGRYEPLGARLEHPDTASFPDAALAGEYTTDLWALLAEHGAGAVFTTAVFTTTLFARTVATGPYLWTVTRQETLETLVPPVSGVEAQAGGRPATGDAGPRAWDGEG